MNHNGRNPGRSRDTTPPLAFEQRWRERQNGASLPPPLLTLPPPASPFLSLHPSLSLPPSIYLLSPVDPRRKKKEKKKKETWRQMLPRQLGSEVPPPAPPSHPQHSQTASDLFICAWGELGSAAVSTPALPLVLKARRRFNVRPFKKKEKEGKKRRRREKNPLFLLLFPVSLSLICIC